MEQMRVRRVADDAAPPGLPIETVHWPADRARRDAFARSGVPRILLVAPGAEVPADLGIDEDWVRLPADEVDIRARVERIRQLSDHLSNAQPFVDAQRTLHRGGLAVQLTPIEASMVTFLLAHCGEVVEPADLGLMVWSSATLSRQVLDAALYRLRQRLWRLGMYIRTIRGRGYVLDIR